MKTALITGASKGIGLAIARQLILDGWKVIGLSRSFQEPLLEGFTPYTINLENLSSLPSELKKLIQAHPTIDAVICNAGRGYFGSLEELSFDKIQSLMDLNFISHVYVIKALLPQFKKRKEGNIILMGSEAALQGKKMGSIYCATKFALRGFAQALREECSSSHIRVSLINPGMVKSSFFDNLSFLPGEDPSEHILPEDVAHAVSFLLQVRPGTVFDEITLSPQRKKIQFL